MPNLVGAWRRAGDSSTLMATLRRQVARVGTGAGCVSHCLTGRDWAAAWVDPGILARQDQPGHADDERVQVLLDGEVLNLAALARDAHLDATARDRGPAHVIAELVCREGIDVVARFNGLFALVVSEDRGRRLSLISDRLGFRPLFWRDSGHDVLFGTELKALVGPGLKDARTDVCAVAEMLVYGAQFAGRPWLQGSHRLAPATVLTFAKGTVTQRRYWTYRYAHESSARSRCVDDLADEFGARLTGAVARAMAAGGRPGVFLSGGYDSRAVAAAIGPSHGNVPAFTFGLQASRDMRIAPQLAARLGLEHHALIAPAPALADLAADIVWRTEGMLPFTNTTSLRFHDRICAHSDVILTGFLGEFSGSHTWPRLLLARSRAGAIAAIRARYVKPRLSAVLRLLHPRHRETVREELLHRFEASFESIADEHPLDVADSWNMQKLQPGGTFQSPAIDRHRFEMRAPHMDADLVAFLLTIPPWTRIEQRVYKTMIARTFVKVRDVPCANSMRPIEPRFWKEYPQMIGALLARRLAAPVRRALGRDDRLGRELSDIDADFRGTPALRSRWLDPMIVDGSLDADLFDIPRIETLIRGQFDAGADHARELSPILSFGLAQRLLAAPGGAPVVDSKPESESELRRRSRCYTCDAATTLAGSG